MGKRIPHKQHIFLWATVFIAAVFFLFLLNGFLSWVAVTRHNQDGVGVHGLTTYILQYADDHGGVLPPMKDVTVFKSAVMPYAGSDAAFRDSEDDQILLLPNPNLSLKPVASVTKLTVLAYESAPSKADGTRWVAFLPQNAVPTPFGDPDFTGLEQIKETDWQRLKAANSIP